MESLSNLLAAITDRHAAAGFADVAKEAGSMADRQQALARLGAAVARHEEVLAEALARRALWQGRVADLVYLGGQGEVHRTPVYVAAIEITTDTWTLEAPGGTVAILSHRVADDGTWWLVDSFGRREMFDELHPATKAPDPTPTTPP